MGQVHDPSRILDFSFGGVWRYCPRSSFMTACRCFTGVPSPHLSSAHPLPWFLLSHLDWSRFIREATMRFGVDIR